MSLTLEDFENKKTLTLADFEGQVNKGIDLNDRSASMVAAQETILNNGSVDTYRDTKNKLISSETRSEFLAGQQSLRDAIWNDAQEGLMDILSSPSYTDEEKVQTLAASRIDVSTLPPPSTMNTLAEEAAIADSGKNETARSAESRFNSLDLIREQNAMKRTLASRINSLELAKNPSTLKTVKDIGELIVPFAEVLHIEKLLAEQGGAPRDIKMLGSRKRQLYDTIEQIPLEDRIAFSEQIIQIIQENPNIVFPDGNDISNLETLNRILLNNDYSNTEYWIDNVSSVLDIVGLGSLVGSIAKTSIKGGKAVSTANRVATLAEEADAFKNRPEPPKNPLQVEAENFKSVDQPLTGKLAEDAAAFTPSKEPVTKLEEEAKKFKSIPEPTEDTLFRKATAESTRTEVSPASPSQIVKDVNPEMAREIHDMVAKEPTGEAAKALYGATKEEALAKDLLPEPAIEPKKLPNKVEMSRPAYEQPEDLRRAHQAQGNTFVTDTELDKIITKRQHGLEDVEGMIMHPSSMIVKWNNDGSWGFTARYSFRDAGFSSVREAVQNAEYAFRRYGIAPSELKILAKKSDGWVVTDLKDIEAKEVLKKSRPNVEKEIPQLKDVEYAIGLDHTYRFSPEDFNEVDLLTVTPGIIARGIQFLDRMPTQILASAGQGSIVQHLLDTASVLHPQIVSSASVAVDKSFGFKALYIKEFKDFTDGYKSLSKARRALMTDYIHQANFDGLKLNTADLYARGFSEKEIKMLKQWRRANDAMWYAANDDMVKTLRGRGYSMFIDNKNDTKLVGRSMDRRGLDPDDLVYDPLDQSVKRAPDKLDELYEKGGTLVRLHDPMEINGKYVDVVISRNTPETGFLRRIYDGEVVMAYRDGYYPVLYDANYFITKTIKVGNRTIHKTIASARNSSELNEALRMLRSSEPDVEFSFHKDRSFNQAGANIFDEGGWSLSSSAGLTNQRFRGQRLGDAGNNLHNLGNTHLKDPLEAVAKQIHQLSQRTSMRTYMDTTKKRWMLSYGDYVQLPRNELTGQLEMPKSPSGIVAKPGAPAAMVGDARTFYNYIYSLENGYINGIDTSYKAVMHMFADFLGQKGLANFEQMALGASKGSPVQFLKTRAFKFFLAASPIRQAILQRSQILMLGAINPTYTAKSLLKDVAYLDLTRYGLIKDPKYLGLLEEVKQSGILEAVDAHNLIRDDMLRLADLTFTQKFKTAIGTPLNYLQKIGFDSAEQDNLLAAWLAHRDLAIKAGKDPTKQRVKEEILGQARAYTLNMNRAGEMPYSQNTLGLFAQFLSFRHKAFLQPFTNKSLSKLDRAKLLAYTTVLFGVDATLIKTIYDMAVGDSVPSDVKDMMKDGLLDVFLNKTLSLASGTEQAIDWGAMAPTEAYGLGNMLVGMMSTDLGEIVSNSPATGLLAGNNPKLMDAIKTGARYFNVIEDYDSDPELQTTFVDVVKATADVFSGASHAFKARYAMKTGQKLSSYGRITDRDVTAIEAVFAVAGFRTKTETGYSKVQEIMYGDKPFENDDVKLFYRELKRHLARRGQTVAELDMGSRVYAEAWRVFGEDRPRAVEVIMKELEKDAQSGDYVMIKSLISRMGRVTDTDMWKMINELPEGDVRDTVSDMMQKIEELNNGD